MFLFDVNVWLALTFDSHVHHPAAKVWFDALTEHTCLFCRITQQGYLRLSTNPKVFGKHSLSMAEAWKSYDTLLSDRCVSFVEEPANLEQHWRNFTGQSSHSPKIWTDAYLAALAIAGNWELVTFDKGFAQYAGVKCNTLV